MPVFDSEVSVLALLVVVDDPEAILFECGQMLLAKSMFSDRPDN